MITGFGNNVVSALAENVTSIQTTLTVMPEQGAMFAKLLTADMENSSNRQNIYAILTLTNATQTVNEICYLTAVRGDVLTVVRGQEGTTARGWSLNDVVANFATRGSENGFVQAEQLQTGQYTAAVAGGSENALAIQLPGTFFLNNSTAWDFRTPIIITPTLTNTGAATLQVTVAGRVLGTFPLYKGKKVELEAGDILADIPIACLLDRTKTFFSVMNPVKVYSLGDGLVRSVNDVLPDDKGAVTLTPQNINAVQANGGKHSSGEHSIYIDWGADGKLHATVDTSDVGELFTTANPPNAAQTGAYPKTGGRVDGEVWSEVVNNFRLVAGNRGVFWRFDGNACYLMFTNNGDPHGGYNDLRPLIADFATGKLSTGHDFTVGGTVFGGHGQCWMATDGNVYGPIWGGYLSNWVNSQIGNLSNSINNQLASMNADRNNCVRATARGGRQHKVGGGWIADWEAPAGCFMTGMNTNEGDDGRKAGIYFRAQYYYTPSAGWVQAGDIA